MYSWQFSKNFPLPNNGGHFVFLNFCQKWKNKFASVSLTVPDRAISFDPTNAKRHEAEIIYMYTNKYLSIIDIFYK